MNILIIGKFYIESFATHISETLKEMGHNTIELEIGFKTKSENSLLFKRIDQFKNLVYSFAQNFKFSKQLFYIKLLRLSSNTKIDLIISCHDFLTYSDISFLKEKLKAPVVLWFPDSLSNFNKMMFINAEYDYLFFKDPYVVDRFRNEYKLNVFYLPEACNPKYHKPVEITDKDKIKYSCEIATAGNVYSSRVAFFSLLSEYDVKIWGNPPPVWMNTKKIDNMLMNEFVAHEAKSKAFRAAKIVINNLHPAEIWGVNVRTFEIAACAGFQIISWRPSLKNLFEVEKEIITFRNIKELKEKIEYFLKSDYERITIANKARERAINEHTYVHRLKIMFDTIFNNAKGYPYDIF